LRSNQGGIAVSGEISVHATHLTIQVCQPATGHDTGILFRTAEGRADFTGGRNHFASLDLLNQPADLARLITGILAPAAVASTPRKTGET
jgi:hypothetical protein